MMNGITESVVNNILDRRLLVEKGESPSPSIGNLETDVSIQPRVNTYPGYTPDGGASVIGGIAGMGGDPSPRTNYMPPVVDRIDVPGLNRRFWDWFHKYHDGEYDED